MPMFLSLFSRECRKISKSVIYYAFIAILVLFYSTQYVNHISGALEEVSFNQRATEDVHGNKLVNILVEPKESDDFFGYRKAEVPDQVMPNVVEILYRECNINKYSSYPLGFIKYVKLSKNDQLRAEEIFHEITGYTLNEYSDYYMGKMDSEMGGNYVYNEYGDMVYVGPSIETPIAESMTYERFKLLMGELDEMIGTGSSYNRLERYGREELTFEDALIVYDNLVNKDKVSGAFARVFSDYIGIVLAFFPVFVVVAYALKDKRARIQELIYSRRASSIKIVGCRLLALNAMMFLPVLLLAIISSIKLMVGTSSLDFNMDSLAFIKYSFGWLLPTLLFTVSLSYLVTELAQNAFGILVQTAIWLYSISSAPLIGGYGWFLILRHNSVEGYEIYKASFNEIARNRIFYGVLSIILFAIASFIYDQKRKGKSYVKTKPIKISRNSSSKSVA